MMDKLITVGLTGMLVFYFCVHIPLDLRMYLRGHNQDLTDYGINSSNILNSTMGIISVLGWLCWILIVLTENFYLLREISPLLFYESDGIIIVITLVILGFSTLIEVWSRFTRGDYAASWGLNDQIPLFTSGPYQVIRHPTYMFYLIMFIILPILSGFLPSLILLLGIPAYYRVAKDEERLLVRHFGQDYKDYQENSWMFFPFIM